MATSFKIVTLGCKVNQYESAFLIESLINAGWRQVSKDDEADVTVVNTCIVTQRASCQSRQAIRKAIRENPSGMTAAVGCYAQVFPEELSGIEGLGIIAGNTEKAQLPAILRNSLGSCGSCLISKDFRKETPFDFLPIKGFMDRTRAFLKIQDGCESFCTYCIVPFARGPLRSLDSANVIRMLQSLSDKGYKEVVLTGIHLGRYGIDLDKGVGLKGLLREIGREGLPLRIRLSSLEPNEIDQELIGMMASEEWLCRHFHIPLQSGDDRILKKMNRHYTAREFAGLVERIHKNIPMAAIGVDTMAGFPGEDQRAYQNTFSLINDLPVSYLHVFPFSPREGTAAAGFPDQVDQQVIKKRTGELRDLGKRKREAFYRSCLGKEFQVLVEGRVSERENMVRGLSDNYLQVAFPSSRFIKNSMVTVRMEGISEDGIIGKSLV
ncbi:MAG: tRNA (N(6)-L-threonylcarbamoyladenosine(37)-C(2))-methylthiotransferase MtaB [Deltaproteobacteria bacterium]|nr:tRNA (N(6)-L-threonylcarbamoyladenosine(37)-C(2))-methylthiotransferase MtaB [Deltaproteobacteria bacterium]